MVKDLLGVMKKHRMPEFVVCRRTEFSILRNSIVVESAPDAWMLYAGVYFSTKSSICFTLKLGLTNVLATHTAKWIFAVT